MEDHLVAARAHPSQRGDGVHRQRQARAEKWADGIFETVERLSVFPESGRVLPDLGRPDVRELTYRNHRVIYRIEGERVLILTIRHWRRLLDISEIDRP